MDQGREHRKDQDEYKVPSWLLKSEGYLPVSDNDRFLDKSTLGLIGVLSRFRLQEGADGRFEPAPLLKLIALVLVILLVSLSTNFIFVLTVLALILLRVCMLPSQALKETVVTAFLAALLSLLIMLPAVFLGSTKSFILIPTKVFISVALALTVSMTTPFNQITASLRMLHVPNMFILTVDLTLKYIVMLGEIALEMLNALKCRSVGKNNAKGASLGNIIGMTFIKSQELALETHNAMICRGFTGEYTARIQHGANQKQRLVSTIASICALIALTLFYCITEGLITW